MGVVTQQRGRPDLEDSLKSIVAQVEEMNARWQCYVERREKYIRAVEQRCTELEQAAATERQHHYHRHQHQQPPHQLTDELQRRIDQMLLDQRHKTELADEARLKVHSTVFTRKS